MNSIEALRLSREKILLRQANDAGTILTLLDTCQRFNEPITCGMEIDGQICPVGLTIDPNSKTGKALLEYLFNWIAGQRYQYWAELDEITRARAIDALLPPGN